MIKVLSGYASDGTTKVVNETNVTEASYPQRTAAYGYSHQGKYIIGSNASGYLCATRVSDSVVITPAVNIANTPFGPNKDPQIVSGIPGLTGRDSVTAPAIANKAQKIAFSLVTTTDATGAFVIKIWDIDANTIASWSIATGFGATVAVGFSLSPDGGTVAIYSIANLGATITLRLVNTATGVISASTTGNVLTNGNAQATTPFFWLGAAWTLDTGYFMVPYCPNTQIIGVSIISSTGTVSLNATLTGVYSGVYYTYNGTPTFVRILPTSSTVFYLCSAGPGSMGLVTCFTKILYSNGTATGIDTGAIGILSHYIKPETVCVSLAGDYIYGLLGARANPIDIAAKVAVLTPALALITEISVTHQDTSNVGYISLVLVPTRRYLIKQGSAWKKWNGTAFVTATVAGTDPTATEFASQGYNIITKISEAEYLAMGNVATTVRLWTDSSGDTPIVTAKATFNPLFLPMNQDLTIDNTRITGINNMAVTVANTGTGDIKLVVSFDSGVTWSKWNGSAWVTVSDTINGGNTVAEFNAITTAAWETARLAGKYRFGITLFTPEYNDVAKISLITRSHNNLGYYTEPASSDITLTQYDGSYEYWFNTAGRYKMVQLGS